MQKFAFRVFHKMYFKLYSVNTHSQPNVVHFMQYSQAHTGKGESGVNFKNYHKNISERDSRGSVDDLLFKKIILKIQII